MGWARQMAKAFHACRRQVAILADGRTICKGKRGDRAKPPAPHGREAEDYVCDVSDADAIVETHANVVAELGDVNILVNNAGKSEAHAFLSVTDEIWQRDLDLKLFAAIRLARLVLPGMCEQRWGRIINILNTAAKAPGPRSAPTSVSRAAGMALTKVLAGEGAPHNVLVNALLIGRIESDQSRRAYDANPGNRTYREYLDAAGSRCDGRYGRSETSGAHVALFLASEHASYLTGCAINMDGGLSQVV